jgi:hypothetical protein
MLMAELNDGLPKQRLPLQARRNAFVAIQREGSLRFKAKRVSATKSYLNPSTLSAYELASSA